MTRKIRSALLLTTASVLLFACSSEPNKIAGKDTAMPPPEQTVKAQPKGLNLASPTMPSMPEPKAAPEIPPATKVAVRDADDMSPNPPPKVETDVATLYDSPQQQAVQIQNVQQAIDIAPPNGKMDVDARIAHLEAAVAALRADYDQILPTFKQLSVNTDRLASLMGQLEGSEKMAAIAPAAGGPKMAAESSGGVASVDAVRFGFHPDKARIVMDVSDLTQYSFDIDNTEKVMVINLPEAHWKAGAQRTPVSSEFIDSWTYQAAPEGGAFMIIQLKNPVKVIARNALPANGSKGPRIYVDIARI